MYLKNVLSVFDGISCGRLALDRAGIQYHQYFASEIDKDCLKLVSEKFPDTIQLGDVKNWRTWNLRDVDLIIGGSPCTGFSCAGNQLNFKDPQSVLFFSFVNLLKSYKPKFFLLENVKMRQEWIEMISQYIGVEPVEINSNLVSAQLRSRLYWVNWEVEQPEDMGVELSQILESNQGWHSASISGRRIDPETGKRSDHNKGLPYTQCVEVRQNPKKSGCITTAEKDSIITRFESGRHLGAYDVLIQGADWRNLTMIELERLQNLPEGYTEGFSNSARRRMIGNGWTVGVIEHIFRVLMKGKGE